MKSNNLLFSVAATALMATFAACSNDLSDVTDSGSSNIRFTSKVIDGAATRGGTDVQTSQLANGLQVGLFSSEIENADNVALTADGNGGLDYSATLKWPAKSTTASFYAYAPYASENDGKIESEINFSVKEDQSSDEDYKASDLLYALTENVTYQSDVTLGFTHKLSKIIVKLTAEQKEITNPTISLTNVVKDVTLNVKSGTLTAGTTTGTVKVGAFTDDASSTGYACAAVIAPQTVKSGVQLVSIEMDGKTYTCSLDADKEFETGKVYTLTVAFDGAAVKLKATTSITAWNEGDGIEFYPSETVVYGVGDYLLADGSFKKHDDVTSGDDVIGVIFSKDVSDTDKKAGYNAYVLSTSVIADAKMTSATFEDGYTQTSKIVDSAADLDGLTHTTKEMGTDATFYDLKSVAPTITANSDNFSIWFIPSIGQMYQILKNLGNVEIPTESGSNLFCCIPKVEEDGAIVSANSSTVNLNTTDKTLTIKGKVFSYVTTPKDTEVLANLKSNLNEKDIFTSNNAYAFSSRYDGTNVHLLKFAKSFIDMSSAVNSSDDADYQANAWGFSSGGLGTNNRGRIACIAAKLP